MRRATFDTELREETDSVKDQPKPKRKVRKPKLQPEADYFPETPELTTKPQELVFEIPYGRTGEGPQYRSSPLRMVSLCNVSFAAVVTQLAELASADARLVL
jgi:hypothetical protein